MEWQQTIGKKIKILKLYYIKKSLTYVHIFLPEVRSVKNQTEEPFQYVNVMKFNYYILKAENTSCYC